MINVNFTEEERQLVLMSLAELSIRCPGFDVALNAVAIKIDNVHDGRSALYDGFREFHPHTAKTEAPPPVAPLSDPRGAWTCSRCGYDPADDDTDRRGDCCPDGENHIAQVKS